MKPTQRVTIPNLLSATRLAAAPAMVAVAWMGKPMWFIALLGLSLLSDLADGILARRLHQGSTLGARLDSDADFATFVAVPLCALLLWPDLFYREAPYLVTGAVFYVLPPAVGILKFGRPTSYHTLGAKVSIAMTGVALLLLFARITPWPLRLCIPVIFFAGLEQLAITVILPRWHANVRSILRAAQIARQSQSKD